jgi:hypothetical protein
VSLPTDPVAHSPSTSRRRRGISRRRARDLAEIGQWWTQAETGLGWRIAQIHRRDGLLLLERPGDGRRYVTFGELGQSYTLLEDDQ